MKYEDVFNALSSDIPELTSDGLAFLSRRLRNEGIVAFQKGMKDAYDAVLHAVASTGNFPDYIPYVCRGCYDVAYSAGIGRVLDHLAFFGKLDVDGLPTPEPWDKFLLRLQEVDSFAGLDLERVFPSKSYNLVRKWIKRKLGPAPKNVIGRHGPGATAEKLVGWDKWLAMDDSPLTTHPWNRLTAVPKDVSGKRIIAIESAKTQFIQQGLARALKNTQFFRDHTDFTEVTEHVMLACRPGQVTVDLKDASDRLGLPFLSLLPPDWSSLLARYSSFAGQLPTGDFIVYPFIASMGCGFCFELETLLFYLVALLSAEPQHMDEIEMLTRKLSVYGDDIVLPGWLLPRFETYCSKVGLVLNPKKTCHTETFRETVGYWICDGIARERFTPRLTGTTRHLTFADDTSRLNLAERAVNAGYHLLGAMLSANVVQRTRFSEKKSKPVGKVRVAQTVTRALNVIDETRWLSYWMEGRSNVVSEPTFQGRCKAAWIPLESWPLLQQHRML